MASIRPLLPLLTAAGILLFGNGILLTLITLRASAEGFEPSLIGLMGAAYFIGFLVACLYVPRLMRAVGHIRVFSAFAAIGSATVLGLVLVPDPYFWMLLRFANGFCFAGLFTVTESWLNESSRNADRAQVLGIYRFVDLAVVTGAQFVIPLFGVGGFTLFALTAMAVALSLVPISLMDSSRPKPPEQVKFDLGAVWKVSPIACFGVVTIGLTNSAFRQIGPLYAGEIGLDVAGVALFVSAGVVGGAALQLPLGWLSDRLDRRWVLITATTGAVMAGLFLTSLDGSDPTLIYVGAFLFGASALPLFSLSSAQAMDHAREGQHAVVAAGLMFLFASGAAVGPLLSSLVVQQFGAPAFFTYTSIVHALLIIAALVRMAQRPAVPTSQRKRFVSLLRTSPAFFRLARRNGTKSHSQP